MRRGNLYVRKDVQCVRTCMYYDTIDLTDDLLNLNQIKMSPIPHTFNMKTTIKNYD